MYEDNIAEQVGLATVHFQGYLEDLQADFEQRKEARQRRGMLVPCFVGHGGCGKDTTAKYFAEMTGATFSGSTSKIVSPMIAWCAGIDEETCYARRGENRTYWYNWCRTFCGEDPARLSRLLLGKSDISAGVRSWIELATSFDERLVDVIVWINKVDTGVDESMDFDAGDILRKVPRPGHEWIDNNKDLSHLRSETERVAQSLDMFEKKEL